MSPSLEPFSEVKYKALMDGLDCNEIRKSELERTLRIDSEFYAKESLTVDIAIRSGRYEGLTQFVTISDGNHTGISEKFIDEGIPYYRGQDAGTFFIESSAPICIDEDTFNLPIMRRSHLQKNDILLSIVGTIGYLSLVYSNRNATCSCKLAILRPKESENSEVLAAFLNCKYGQAQIKRFTRGAIQKGLILEDMDQLVVPDFDKGFKEIVRTTVIAAYKKQGESSAIYIEAQNLLSQSLNIDFSKIPRATISTKRYLQSAVEVGRLDAEYYQPKYDYIEKRLLEYDPNLKTLSEVATYIFTGEYAKEYFYKSDGLALCYYIRGTDIDSGCIEKDDFHCVDPTHFNKFVSAGDIVTGRVGTIGNFGVVDDSLNGAACSDNILCFRLPSEYLPDVYTLYFNSPIIKSFIKRLARGSVQQRLNQETLREVAVPLIQAETQSEISSMVLHSYRLRQESKRLLEYAKQAVEIAIEQGEEKAITWLKERAGEQ